MIYYTLNITPVTITDYSNLVVLLSRYWTALLSQIQRWMDHQEL